MQFASLFLLMLASVAYAQDARRDGNWWREHTPTERAMYMIGFFDGMDLGNNFSYWGTKENGVDLDPDVAKEAVDSYRKMQDKYLTNVSNIQISDGLTKFYEDYRNRKIKIRSAVWIVLNSIAGKSEAEIEKLSESFRKHAE